MKDVKSQATKIGTPGKQGGLNAEIQSRIGHQLRAMYDDVVRQGVPDRFAELIRKLDTPEGVMPLTDSLRDDILASVPSLRAFAISLSGNGDRADDLVQETLLRALANIDSFQPGSNLPAWLFTILRNLFRSDYRKRRREVEDADGSYAKTLKTQPAQNAHLEFEEFRAALDKLPQDQREALILVGASGFSYEDAAAICGCAVGTIKSRVNRARSKLSALLYVDGAEDFGPDDTVRAVIGGSGG
jgi:RNA polymerase sigma-70 factor (ECF subfamily)